MSWKHSQPFHNASITNTPVLVKGQQCKVTSYDILSKNTVDVFLHMYDALAAADVTVGTTVPKAIKLCEYGDGTHYTGFSREHPEGLEFAKGLVIAVTDEYNVDNAPTVACPVNITLM